MERHLFSLTVQSEGFVHPQIFFFQIDKPKTPPKPEAKPVTVPDAPTFKTEERLEQHAFMASARKSRTLISGSTEATLWKSVPAEEGEGFAGATSAEAEAAEKKNALFEEKRINKAYEDMSVQELRRCCCSVSWGLSSLTHIR